MIKALNSTNNSSSPGPDGISYRLLKLLKHTDLGKALLHDINSYVRDGIPPNRELTMVMVPKPGKDHRYAKGWRPIVLANTTAKVAEKIIVREIHRLPALHEVQYGSRPHRNATDCQALYLSIAERTLRSGGRATLLGKDIKSAFNNLSSKGVLSSLQEADAPDPIKRYVTNFLRPRTFDIGWEGITRGRESMNKGTIQGSPISPVLWLIFAARILKMAEDNLMGLNTTVRGYNPYQSHPRTIGYLFSYVDDFNPLIISHQTSLALHDEAVHQTDLALQEAAAHYEVEWDVSKNTTIHFRHPAGGNEREKTTKSLGIHISPRFNWLRHISQRLNLAEKQRASYTT